MLPNPSLVGVFSIAGPLRSSHRNIKLSASIWQVRSELTAKLTDDTAADEYAAKSLAGGRLFNSRPFTLFPPQHQIVGFNLPGDMNHPLTDAQRAILHSVGGQLVQHKSQARKGTLADHQIRPTDDNAFRVSGARKIGIWLKNSFEQTGQRRLANYLSIGLQAAKDEVMGPRESIQPAQ